MRRRFDCVQHSTDTSDFWQLTLVFAHAAWRGVKLTRMRNLFRLLWVASCACAAPAKQTADSPVVSGMPAGVPGPPAPGMVWDQQERPTFCEKPAVDTGTRVLSWPDSTSAVTAAKRALGSHFNEHMDLGTLARTRDGVLLQFRDRRAGIPDGSASVYVTIGPCVTLLGW
jgi:hypothetical protein